MKPAATQERKEALSTLISDVLGELAFMVLDDDDPVIDPDGDWIECSVSYHGPVSGSLTCWCTREFANSLCMNLLGCDPSEDEGVDVGDAIREFMNIICGQVITSWHGTKAVFNLSIPNVRDGSPPSKDPADQLYTHSCSVSGEALLFLYSPQDGESGASA